MLNYDQKRSIESPVRNFGSSNVMIVSQPKAHKNGKVYWRIGIRVFQGNPNTHKDMWLHLFNVEDESLIKEAESYLDSISG